MKITLDLPTSEYCGLKQVAAKYGITTHEILAGFVADATGSFRSGGSDERQHADDYIARRHSDYIQHSADPESLAERDLRFLRSERWYDAERRHATYERQKREQLRTPSA